MTEKQPNLTERMATVETSLATIATALAQLVEAPTVEVTETTQVKGKAKGKAKDKRPTDIKQAAYWNGTKKVFVLIPYVKGKGPQSSTAKIAKHKDDPKGGVLMTRMNGDLFMVKRTSRERPIMTAAMLASLSR